MGGEVGGGPAKRRRLHRERPGLPECPRFLQGSSVAGNWNLEPMAWVQMPAMLLPSSVILGNLLYFSVPCSLHLQMQIIIIFKNLSFFS